MNNKLADQLQVWGFQDDFIIFSDGSLGFGLELSPISISCWDDSRVNQLAEQAAHFLNSLPSGLSLQILQEISGDNSRLLLSHQELGLSSQNEVSLALTKERINRLTDLDQNGHLPKQSLRIFARKMPSNKILHKPSIFSKPKLFQKIAESNLQRELTFISSFLEDLTKGLESLGISSRQIKTDDLVNILYRQWNPTRPIELNGYDPEDVRSSILFSDVNVYEQGFAIGEMHHRVISLKLLPQRTVAGMSRALSTLPFGSQLFLSMYVPDQQKEIESLQTQRRLAYSIARGKQTGVSDLESEAKFEDLESLLSEMISNGEKVFHVSFNIVLQSADKDQLEHQVAETLMKIRELAGAEGMLESLASFDIFSEFSIPNSRAKERAKSVKTSNLVDLLPMFGSWKGHSQPSILLRSREGTLVSFDPFSNNLTNYNQIVSGGSGSGKSFLTNILLLQMLKENPKIFIVDIGGSYKKLSDNLSGQYIPLGVDGGLSVNPFDLLPEEIAPSSSKIKFLVGLIEMMTKEEGDSSLKRLQRVEIEEAIQKVYEKNKTPTLSHLKQILSEHSDVEIRRLGRILASWCGDSPYGKFVDRPTTIALQKSIVCFDLKGMESYPDLQAICLYIITDFVWREVQKDRGSKKFLVFDECWKLLENEAGSHFIAEVFRTFRKYFASAIAISQNIDDFARSKIATAILSNSAVKWILMQKGADQERLKEVLQLNENEMGLISSLYQERGLYSEAFLIAQDERSTVVIESTPLEYWIATTDPRDLAEIQKLSNSNLDQLSVLKTLSEKYPRGVTASIKGMS